MEAEVVRVSAEQLARAPTAPAEGATGLLVASEDEGKAQLESTPSLERGGIHCPLWPLCCDRIATLVRHVGAGADVRAACSLEPGIELDADADVYQCRACGRLYCSWSHP